MNPWTERLWRIDLAPIHVEVVARHVLTNEGVPVDLHIRFQACTRREHDALLQAVERRHGETKDAMRRLLSELAYGVARSRLADTTRASLERGPAAFITAFREELSREVASLAFSIEDLTVTPSAPALAPPAPEDVDLGALLCSVKPLSGTDDLLRSLEGLALDLSGDDPGTGSEPGNES